MTIALIFVGVFVLASTMICLFLRWQFDSMVKDLMTIAERIDVQQGVDEIRFLHDHNNGFGNVITREVPLEERNPELDASYKKWYEENYGNVVDLFPKGDKTNNNR